MVCLPRRITNKTFIQKEFFFVFVMAADQEHGEGWVKEIVELYPDQPERTKYKWTYVPKPADTYQFKYVWKPDVPVGDSKWGTWARVPLDEVDLSNPTSLGQFFEAMGYEYLGPGTKVEQKLKAGVKPKDELDRVAMQHDYTYLEILDMYNRGDVDYKTAVGMVRTADLEFLDALRGTWDPMGQLAFEGMSAKVVYDYMTGGASFAQLDPAKQDPYFGEGEGGAGSGDPSHYPPDTRSSDWLFRADVNPSREHPPHAGKQWQWMGNHWTEVSLDLVDEQHPPVFGGPWRWNSRYRIWEEVPEDPVVRTATGSLWFVDRNRDGIDDRLQRRRGRRVRPFFAR